MRQNAMILIALLLVACPGTDVVPSSGGGDAWHPDTKPFDGQSLDAVGDASPRDVASPDRWRPDSAAPDTSQPDVAVPDAGQPDVAVADTDQPDVAVADTAQPDVAVADASHPDTAAPDSSLPDIAALDSHQQDSQKPDAGVGRVFYVSNGGDDDRNGRSPDDAWESLNKVNLSSFLPNDRILFRRGDTWNSQLLIPSSGDSSGAITFGAFGNGAKPIFDGTGVDLPRNHGLIRGSTRNYIVISDIRVQNVGIGDVDENTGIGFYGGSHLTVRDCEVYNTESAGLKFNTSSYVTVDGNEVTKACQNSRSESVTLSVVNTFEVLNNIVSDGGSAAGGGAGIDAKDGSHDGTIHHNEVFGINGANAIYVDAYGRHTYNIEVYANYVHNTEGAGIQIGSESGGLLENISVHHNVVHDAVRGAVAFHNLHSTSGAVRDVSVFNNTFFNNGSSSVAQYGNIRVSDELIENLNIKNNIMSQSHNFHVGVLNNGPPASEYTVDYNVLHGSQSSSGGFTAIAGTNAIEEDPLFVTAGEDFHLQSGSLAKDACDNSVWQGTPNIADYDGVPITDGAGNIVAPGDRVSCGAFE